MISSLIRPIYLDAIELSVTNQAVTTHLTGAHSYSSLSHDFSRSSSCELVVSDPQSRVLFLAFSEQIEIQSISNTSKVVVEQSDENPSPIS